PSRRRAMRRSTASTWPRSGCPRFVRTTSAGASGASRVSLPIPATTHFLDLLEPGAPPVVDDWELGLSALGETTDLH
ncbi:MAG TPA: hypothetical protein VFS43_41075, partial [Polyangiaceae bacterium]|nr:hypothetical protein [Polyangiaceae bacterium]